MFRLFRQDDPGGPAQEWVDELLKDRLQAQPEEDRNLYCFVCGRIVTSVDHRIPVQGAREHTCTNPGGYVYTIGCFREAEGCEEAGELTEAFSWFPGFAWRYAFCGGCGVHLGWVYEGSGETPEGFFGLILNRLVAGRDSFPSTS